MLREDEIRLALQEIPEDKPHGKRRFVLKDIRLFYNSIEHAMDIVRSPGSKFNRAGRDRRMHGAADPDTQRLVTRALLRWSRTPCVLPPRRLSFAALHRRTSPALDLYIKLQARSLLPRSLRRTGFSFAHRSFPCAVSRACSNCSIDRSAFSRVRLLCIISPSKMFHVKHFLIPSVILFHVKPFL